MCSIICRPLIFNQLKIRVHPEVNSLKWITGVCREGEHHLLLRKELGNEGKRDSACYDYDQPAATDAIISPFAQQQATAVS